MDKLNYKICCKNVSATWLTSANEITPGFLVLFNYSGEIPDSLDVISLC